MRLPHNIRRINRRMAIQRKSIPKLFLVFFSFFSIPLLLQAQTAEPVATLRNVSGEVNVWDGAQGGGAATGQKIPAGSIIVTGPDGRADIEHGSGFVSTLSPDSMARVNTTLFKLSGLILVYGQLQTQGERHDLEEEFRVITPVAVAAVRGTSFIVVSARDGSSLVGVSQGTITTGIGREVLEVAPGFKTEGQLAAGYAPSTSGSLATEEGRAWRANRERDLRNRVQQVLEELGRLQKQEDADWAEIAATVETISQRIQSGQMTAGDRFFFRRVFDLEDRKAARRLLAIHLRQWAGISRRDETASEIDGLQKEWEARDWRRKTWEEVEEGKIPSQPMPENLRQFQERMEQDMQALPQEVPQETPVRPDTAVLFPEVVKGLYLGISEGELQRLRPRAQAGELSEPTDDIPVVYSEKELSGGDWGKEGWFTGMYTVHRGKMVQGSFLAFSGIEKLRAELREKFNGLYGPPWRSRLEPDWVQPGTFKGSTLEWRGNGLEVILISRTVPTLQGLGRGLELRIRLAGFDAVLENPGQFSPAQGPQADEQIQKDFP